MRLAIAFLFLTLTACGDKTRVIDIGVAPPAQPDLTKISTIPNGCVALVFDGQMATGSHEFAPGDIRPAVGFDCGVREGLKCFYYLHLDNAGVKTQDIRCE